MCVRCGTQTQSQVEDAAEMGLEEAEGGDVFGGGGGPTARGLRRRVGGSRREGRVKEVRLGKRARTAMRDGRRAVEAYASAFQAVLEAQCARLVRRGVVSRREDGEGEGESARAFGVGLEVTVREVWARYARESGVLDVAEDAGDGDRGGDAGEEKTSTEKWPTVRELSPRRAAAKVGEMTAPYEYAAAPPPDRSSTPGPMFRFLAEAPTVSRKSVRGSLRTTPTPSLSS